jgi:DNA modification methylase
MRDMEDESVDLAIVDPPYGIDFRSNYRKSSTLKTTEGIANDGKDNAGFLTEVITELSRVMKEGSHVYWFTRWDKVPEQQPLLECHFRVKNSLIWMKNNWSMGDLRGAYAGQYENILFAQKGRRLLNEVDGRSRHSDILQFDRVSPSKLRHSHEKPVDLISFLIRKSSAPGETVLIPFAGSGTDCEAAAASGRNFVAFELDADHVMTAEERLRAVC